ncbi:MAG: alpha/beta fold hydrolase [Candidatus Thiodiazotropha sp.]
MRTRKRQALIRCLLLLLVVSTVDSLYAVNLSREMRISEGLEARVSEGDAIWLEADSRPFLAIHRESSASVRHGGAILLHDSNTHADWHEVIKPLRRQLAARGWVTLSLQLPLGDPATPANSASLFSLSRPRIQAAIEFLKGQQVEETVLIGHGLGGAMAMDFMISQGEGILGLVAIGITSGSEGQEDSVTQALEATQVPILDLYGSQDLPGVVESARVRQTLAARSGRIRYRQERVAGADHFFSGMQEELNSRVAAWLRQTVRQWKTTRPPSKP